MDPPNRLQTLLGLAEKAESKYGVAERIPQLYRAGKWLWAKRGAWGGAVGAALAWIAERLPMTEAFIPWWIGQVAAPIIFVSSVLALVFIQGRQNRRLESLLSRAVEMEPNQAGNMAIVPLTEQNADAGPTSDATVEAMPVLTAYDKGPPPRIQIRNDGARGIFNAQCEIRRGNTGEFNRAVPVKWEMGDESGAVQLGRGQDRWLQIERPQITPDIPFRDVELGNGVIQSSTGGKMPAPDNPWIEFKVDISGDGGQLIIWFRWCSVCGFRDMGSVEP